MKFILSLPNWYKDWELVVSAAIRADELGLWGLAMPDHYLRAQGRDDATLDSWIGLCHLASKTNAIHVGTMVTPIPFRPPAILAKMVSTLDVISKGRTFLGVGAGWSRREFEAYSEWNEPSVRVSKTEEGLGLILDLWTKDKVEFQGKYYHVKGGALEPKPIQKPHPPLMFGGLNRRMLKLAGKYGDIVFLPPLDRLSFIEAKDIVRKAAKESKRTTKFSFAADSPADIGQHHPPKYDLDRFRNAVLEAEKNECDYFVLSVPEDGLIDSLSDFGRNVMPSFN